jgi:SAM-dependent methyltransferase
MIHYRGYGSYEAYLAHQCSKGAVHSGLVEYGKKLITELIYRFGEPVECGESMLCLGARTGAEVEAFRRVGMFAWGIDINPGDNNSYVTIGDFDNILLFDNTVDNIYTNSLDHSADLTKTLTETKRVLKPGGYFFLDIVNGTEQGYAPGAFEACWWDTVDDVIEIAEKYFKVISRAPIECPWPGEFVVLRNTDET